MNRYPTFSVLDIGPIRSNQDGAQCVASMVALARHAETHGYHRYWLAEHHNVAAVAASHTSVLATAIGARTRTIRIGGCVLLPHYPPFLVAEQMGLLEACFPGRVDIGIGRSTGGDRIATALLRGDSSNPHEHVQSIVNLMAMLTPGGTTLAVGDSDYLLQSVPNASSAPAPWILGTSHHSASLAAELGLPYAFGYHIQGEGVDEAIALYRARFRPSSVCERPRVLLSAIVVVGDTAEEAELLARPQLHFMSAFRSGETVHPQMLVEDAADLPFAPRHEELVAMFRRTWIIGDAQQAHDQIEQLAARLDLEEFMINPVAAAYRADDPARAPNRERTIAALAQMFQLRKLAA